MSRKERIGIGMALAGLAMILGAVAYALWSIPHPAGKAAVLFFAGFILFAVGAITGEDA